MSKIIPAEQAASSGAQDLNLGNRKTPSPHPGRPSGGVRWLKGEEGQPQADVQFERRLRGRRGADAGVQAELEKMQGQAYRDGFSQGETAGRKLAAQKVQSVLESLETLLESMGRERTRLIESCQEELIQIAFVIACRVLHREIETHTDAVLPVIRAALEKVTEADEIVIKVSPYDLELIHQQMDQMAALSQTSDGEGDSPGEDDWRSHLPPNVKIEEEIEIGRGGCKIIASRGIIDATIQTELRRIKDVLWGEGTGSMGVGGGK